MENPESRQCKFCELPSAKYTCPRCGFAYCSGACYKDARHRNCSEDFYKDWVHTYLRTEQADPEARRKMMDVLASAHREEEGEQDKQEELVERLAEVDLDDAESAWSCLTADEKAEFEELVASGSAGKLVPVWQPWWERAPLIAEVAPTDATSDVPPLNRLTSQPPAPCVVNSALNVLCGYVYVARLYNGDLLSESALELLSVSAVLSEDAVFASASEAVQSLLQWTLTLREQTTAEEFPAVLASFRKLLEGAGLGDNVVRALEEVRALLQGRQSAAVWRKRSDASSGTLSRRRSISWHGPASTVASYSPASRMWMRKRWPWPRTWPRLNGPQRPWCVRLRTVA
ncbi:conserved hypothetical protein [Ixodes scapularis]|uniref:HIT-type domain-containing protein n=1 Tax=Ixodes scapularis TaxID=6945 RepID=B7PLB1_IXOSC|nr:conserved hypothetical protein [Ixodes scapularis]|eukprot:XP_002434558.1 conserved hypothetical protein [Ixodes scapularis]